MTRPKSVAVTGASGYVGQFVCRGLAAAGYRVTGLSRRPHTQDRFGVSRWLRGDLANASSRSALLDQLLDGQQALVHCALAHEPGRYRGGEGGDPSAFWERNLLPGLALLDRAAAHGVQRVLFMSSRAVFDGLPAQSTPLADDSPVRPTTHYGALKAAEEALIAAAPADGPVCTALRLTGVYGCIEPVEDSKWMALIRDALGGATPPEARLASEVSGVDVASAVGILLAAAEGEVRGRVFNCADRLVSRREVLALVAQQTGRSLELPEVGVPPARIMDCDGLRSLGWEPGGDKELTATVFALVARVPQ
ncbi:MAG: NAD(P)-dependent oxidoreductase [Pseudomonadota bacterium]